jgi:hypothetical protein
LKRKKNKWKKKIKLKRGWSSKRKRWQVRLEGEE